MRKLSKSESKTQGSSWTLQEPLVSKNPTLHPNLDIIIEGGGGSGGKVVTESYYHVTPMDKHVNWMKLAHLLSNFLWDLEHPLVCIPFFQNS